MRRLPQRVFDFYWGEGIADDVPALTYYLVLSLAPFALGVAALEALLIESFVSAVEVADQINRFLPETVHGDVERLVTGTRDDSPLLIALGLAAMLWTSSGGIGVIERCLSRIVGCPRHDVVTGRIRNLVLGGAVAAAVILASLSTSAITDLSGALQLRDTIPGGALVLANTVGSVILFALIYRYAPRARLAWRSALLGGLPAGVGIQLVPAVVGVYVGAAAGLQAVRLFLALAVVLLGLYIVAMVVLVGAGLAARTERHRDGGCRADRRSRVIVRDDPAPPPLEPALRD
jgi:membrane protein